MKRGFILGLYMLAIIGIMGTAIITSAGAINYAVLYRHYYIIPFAIVTIVGSIFAAYRFAKSKDMI